MKDSRKCECGHLRVDHVEEKPRWFETFAYGAMRKYFHSKTGECSFCLCPGYSYKEGGLEEDNRPVGLRTPVISA